jgi:hypothetical protein
VPCREVIRAGETAAAKVVGNATHLTLPLVANGTKGGTTTAEEEERTRKRGGGRGQKAEEEETGRRAASPHHPTVKIAQSRVSCE